MTTKGDFLHCISKEVRVFLREPLSGKWELEGLINKVEGDSVCLDIRGSIIEIPIGMINRAKQIV